MITIKTNTVDIQHPSVHVSANGSCACGTLKCKQGEVIVLIVGIETIFLPTNLFSNGAKPIYLYSYL